MSPYASSIAPFYENLKAVINDRTRSDYIKTNQTTVGRSEVLTFEDRPENAVFILNKGWLLIERRIEGDEPQILDYALPGEILCHPFSSADPRQCVWHTIEDAEIEWLVADDSTFAPYFVELVLEYETLRSALMFDRLCASLHGGSDTKMALFILQTLDWLKATNPAYFDRFRCPMSQTQIGAILGITNIHVSRIFSRLETSGLIKRHKSFIEVSDREGLEKLCGYQGRF